MRGCVKAFPRQIVVVRLTGAVECVLTKLEFQICVHISSHVLHQSKTSFTESTYAIGTLTGI